MADHAAYEFPESLSARLSPLLRSQDSTKSNSQQHTAAAAAHPQQTAADAARSRTHITTNSPLPNAHTPYQQPAACAVALPSLPSKFSTWQQPIQAVPEPNTSAILEADVLQFRTQYKSITMQLVPFLEQLQQPTSSIPNSFKSPAGGSFAPNPVPAAAGPAAGQQGYEDLVEQLHSLLASFALDYLVPLLRHR